MEKDSGLCLSCNAQFAQQGKLLTEKIIDAKNKVATAKEPKDVAALCQSIEQYGSELVELHKAYNLQPSQELLDMIETYKKKAQQA
jgi:UDP-glucose 6-dehydrogenase